MITAPFKLDTPAAGLVCCVRLRHYNPVDCSGTVMPRADTFDIALTKRATDKDTGGSGPSYLLASSTFIPERTDAAAHNPAIAGIAFLPAATAPATSVKVTIGVAAADADSAAKLGDALAAAGAPTSTSSAAATLRSQGMSVTGLAYFGYDDDKVAKYFLPAPSGGATPPPPFEGAVPVPAVVDGSTKELDIGAAVTVGMACALFTLGVFALLLWMLGTRKWQENKVKEMTDTFHEAASVASGDTPHLSFTPAGNGAAKNQVAPK